MTLGKRRKMENGGGTNQRFIYNRVDHRCPTPLPSCIHNMLYRYFRQSLFDTPTHRLTLALHVDCLLCASFLIGSVTKIKCWSTSLSSQHVSDSFEHGCSIKRPCPWLGRCHERARCQRIGVHQGTRHFAFTSLTASRRCLSNYYFDTT